MGQDVALPLANRFERFMIPRLGFEDFLLLAHAGRRQHTDTVR